MSAGLRAAVRVSHRRAEDVFDRADQPAYLAAFQLGTVNLFRGEDAQTISVIDSPVLMILSPLRMVPFLIRTSDTTPR